MGIRVVAASAHPTAQESCHMALLECVMPKMRNARLSEPRSQEDERPQLCYPQPSKVLSKSAPRLFVAEVRGEQLPNNPQPPCVKPSARPCLVLHFATQCWPRPLAKAGPHVHGLAVLPTSKQSEPIARSDLDLFPVPSFAALQKLLVTPRVGWQVIHRS